jgi:very-short-patch-repair endonuclease
MPGIDKVLNGYVRKGIWLYKKGAYSQAIEYFQKAADENHPKAWSHLAKAYHEGNGVAKDPIKAQELFFLVEIVAKQGNLVAQTQLKWMHKNGYEASADTPTKNSLKTSKKAEENIQKIASTKLENIKTFQRIERRKKQTEKRTVKKKQNLDLHIAVLCSVVENQYGYKYIIHMNLVAIKNLIRENWRYLSLNLVLDVLGKLSIIQEGRRSQNVIETIIVLLLERLSNLIPPAKSSKDLSINQLNTIFNLLPDLNVCHQDFKKLYEKLLCYTTLFIQLPENEDIELYVSILNTIAILALPIKKDFIQTLIQPFEDDSYTIQSLNARSFGKLFEALVYIKLKIKMKMKISLSKINSYISKCPPKHNSTISLAQKAIYKQIDSILLPQYRKELSQEHLVGPYALDLVIPSMKINFETDGMHHYKLGRLRVKDQFRDWVLKKYYKYTVFRFSTFSINDPLLLKKTLRPIAELLKPKVYETKNIELLSQKNIISTQVPISISKKHINSPAQMQRFYESNKSSPSPRMRKKFIACRSAIFVDQIRLFCFLRSSESELSLKEFNILLKQVHIKRLLLLWNTSIFSGKALSQILQNKTTPEKLDRLEAYINKNLEAMLRLRQNSSLQRIHFYNKKQKSLISHKVPSREMLRKFTAGQSSITVDQERLLCFLRCSEHELSLKKFNAILKEIGADRLRLLWNANTSFGKPLSQMSQYKMKVGKLKCLLSNITIKLDASSSSNQKSSAKKSAWKSSTLVKPKKLNKSTPIRPLPTASSSSNQSLVPILSAEREQTSMPSKNRLPTIQEKTVSFSLNCHLLFPPLPPIASVKSVQSSSTAKAIKPLSTIKPAQQFPVARTAKPPFAVKQIQPSSVPKKTRSSSSQPLPVQENWSNAQRRFMACQDSIETDQQRLICFLKTPNKNFPLEQFDVLLMKVSVIRLRLLCNTKTSNGKYLLQKRSQEIIPEKWHSLQKRITPHLALYSSQNIAILSTSVGIFKPTTPPSVGSSQSSSSLRPNTEQKNLAGK